MNCTPLGLLPFGAQVDNGMTFCSGWMAGHDSAAADGRPSRHRPRLRGESTTSRLGSTRFESEGSRRLRLVTRRHAFASAGLEGPGAFLLIGVPPKTRYQVCGFGGNSLPAPRASTIVTNPQRSPWSRSAEWLFRVAPFFLVRPTCQASTPPSRERRSSVDFGRLRPRRVEMRIRRAKGQSLSVPAATQKTA